MKSFLRSVQTILIMCFVFSFGMAQSLDEIKAMHDERPDDPYVAVDKSLMPRQPARSVRTPNFYTTQVNIDENGDDIIGDAGNEPSIAFDPTNNNRIVIGWRQFDNISSNFRQAGYGYSLDGGLTFTNPGVLDPGNFRSDPVLDFDEDGNLYYNSLQGTFECDVWKITDGGVEWEPPVPAFGGDKQWMRIDRSGTASAGHNYSYWNTSFTTCAPGAFTRSTDGSDSFEDCETIDDEPFWGTLTVDSAGDLYLVGRTGPGIVIVKSTNAKNPAEVVDWDFVSDVDLDGQLSVFQPINPAGLTGQAWVDVDVSGGPTDGYVYVLASVDRFSNSDPADVMFAKSTDGGLNFSPPVRVNIDPGTDSYQWFGTMSVAPNGRIDVVYLDTSDAPAGTQDSRLIYTWSDDQGDTWNDYLWISDMFDPNIGYPDQDKMGDYFDMKSDNDFAHLAWCNTLNGGQDVYYTRISPEGILSVDDIAGTGVQGFVTYPNPFSDTTKIEFQMADSQEATIRVMDVQGRVMATLLDETVQGKTSLQWDGTDNGGNKLASGLYFIQLKTKGGTYTKKALLKR